ASSNDLIDFLARSSNVEGRQFLKTYFNRPGTRCEELVSRLAAKPWSRLFSFLASEGVIDDDETSIRLLNAALLSAGDFEAFEIDENARALIARLHAELPAFGETSHEASTKALFAFLSDAVPSVPDLRVL